MKALKPLSLTLLTASLIAGMSLFVAGRVFSVCASPTNQYVSLTVNNPNGTVTQVPQVPWIQNMNVHLAMRNANSVNPAFTFQTAYYCPYGSYVTSIDGFTESSPYYWALYVNGQFAQFGIDTQLLNPGDAIAWRVESGAQADDSAKATSHQAKLHELHMKRKITTIKKAKG